MNYSAAYQYELEDSIDSIEKGKEADFAILDRDLPTIDPGTIRSAKVVAAIVAGDTDFKK